jgi:hypothetical protein
MPFRDQASERRGPDKPIEVELGAQSASQVYVDLSGRIVGVFASSFLILERDTHVHLIISFPDGRTIRAAGLVQFVRTGDEEQLPGLGIAFTEILPDDSEVVREFAERIRPPMLYDE